MPALTTSDAWVALREHQAEIATMHMRDMFAADPARFEKFSVSFSDILFDYSKNRITEETVSLLLALAEQAGCNPSIKRLMKMTSMSNRAVINNYEKLEKDGFITITKNAGEGVRARSNSYELHLEESERGSQRLGEKDSEPYAGVSEPYTEVSERGSHEPLRTLIEPLQNHTPESDKSNQAESSTDSFEKWWCVYPKEGDKSMTCHDPSNLGNKEKSVREWNLLKPDVDQLIADIEERKASDRKWLAGYAPLPENYLKDKKWKEPIQTDSDSNAGSPTKLPRDDSQLGKWAVENGVHECGKAPSRIQNRFEYRQYLTQWLKDKEPVPSHVPPDPTDVPTSTKTKTNGFTNADVPAPVDGPYKVEQIMKNMAARKSVGR